MPTQESTRQELRENVGYLLGVFRTVTAAAAGSTTTLLIDDTPNKTADDFNGRFLQFTSGNNNDGLTRVVTNTTVSSNRVTMTFFPAVTDATATNDTAELWDQPYDPDRIHNLFNQAVDAATGQIFDETDSITTGDHLHTGGRATISIPTTFELLKAVEARTSMVSQRILDSGIAWDESIGSDFTVEIDSEQKVFDRTTTRFTIGSGVSSGDIATQAIGATDLSGQTHIEFGIKVRDAVASDDLRLRLSATANGASTTEEIIIPAISALSETWVRVAMTAPSVATAIISVALEYNANPGDNIVWMTEIEATQERSYTWTPIAFNLWSIDKEAREIVFTRAGMDFAGYSLLKLIGGDNPARLTTDSSVTEIPERYMVNFVAGTLQNRPIKGEDPSQARVRLGQAATWLSIAEAARRSFPILRTGRWVT